MLQLQFAASPAGLYPLRRFFPGQRTVEHLNPAVILQSLPADALRQNQARQRLWVLSLPACQQILQPVVPQRIRHTVTDHYREGSRLQPGAGYIRGRRGAPHSHRQAAAGHPPYRASLFQVAGGSAVLVKHSLPCLRVKYTQIHRGEAAALRSPKGHGGIEGLQRGFGGNTGLQELTLPESLQSVGNYAFYGSIYETQPLVFQKNEDLTIDVSDFASGVYFIQIKTEEGNITKRFVKE